MRVLDLFCGAGGAAMGLHQAWPDAEITGVDIKPQPRYPFAFVQADVMTYPLDGYDFIWASPPCQAYSKLNSFGLHTDYPDLYAATRERLQAVGGIWAIENVEGAPYLHGVILCGSMFGLGVRRHRNFETSHFIFRPPCRHDKQGPVISVCGHPGGTRALRGRAGSTAEWREVMGIDWMDGKTLAQAIPPAYSKYIAEQLTPVFREDAA